MTWLFNENLMIEPPQDAIGFVYVISNLIDGRKYYGKKILKFKKTSVRTVKIKSTGLKKKKKTRTQVDSDWRDYYGSSDELKADIEKLGEENFKREIIRFCSSLTELGYYEAKIQFETDCLLNPSKFYNRWIMVRVRSAHLSKLYTK